MLPKHFYKQAPALEHIREHGGYLFKYVDRSGKREKHLFCVCDSVADLPRWIKNSHEVKHEIVESIHCTKNQGVKFYFDLDCFKEETKGKLANAARPVEIMRTFEECFCFCVEYAFGDADMSDYRFMWSFGESETKLSFHLTVNHPNLLWFHNASRDNESSSQKTFVEILKSQINSNDRWAALQQIENGKPNSIVDESVYNGKRSLLRCVGGYSSKGRVLRPCRIEDDSLVLVEDFDVNDYLNNVPLAGEQPYAIREEFLTAWKREMREMDESNVPSTETDDDSDDDEPREDPWKWLLKKLQAHESHIRRFIQYRLKNVSFRDIHFSGSTPPVVRLQNEGCRVCPINGEKTTRTMPGCASIGSARFTTGATTQRAKNAKQSSLVSWRTPTSCPTDTTRTW